MIATLQLTIAIINIGYTGQYGPIWGPPIQYQAHRPVRLPY